MKPTKSTAATKLLPVTTLDHEEPTSSAEHAAAIKAKFTSGDPSRVAAFERALLEVTAKLAVADYLRVLGVIE